MLVEDDEEFHLMRLNGFISRPVVSGYIPQRIRCASSRFQGSMGSDQRIEEMPYEGGYKVD
jgi:hypothetical protein